MGAPLYNQLIKYSQSKLAFHMPGHKFGQIAGLSQMDLSKLDNTEAVGMDNLYEAEGVIKEAMGLMAHFYGSKQSIFLTNGSTVGILTSILATCKEGDQFIIARNAHHSVWSALVLAGVSPIYISPEYIYEEDLLGKITPEIVEEALKQYPNARGVMVVSPTYEGIVSDIQSIAEIVHRYNKILIVDEAHGAHFVLGNAFPKSSIVLGADLVINSMHKTLPTLTQSALIHICSERVEYEKIISTLRMIQTSSPSYVMMGLMDYMREYIISHIVEIEEHYIKSLIVFREQLKEKLKVLKLIEYEANQYDRSKVIISTLGSDVNGYELANQLNERFNIAVEAALEHYIILMTTMADQKDSLDRLRQALIEIDSTLKGQARPRSMNSFITEKISLGKNPRSIFYSEKCWMKLSKCQDRVSSKNIMLYPPGIPIMAIGEKVKEQDILFIQRLKNKLQGIRLIDDEIWIEVTK